MKVSSVAMKVARSHVTLKGAVLRRDGSKKTLYVRVPVSSRS